MLTVDLSGSRIILQTDRHVAGLDRSIPGAYFRTRDRIWTFPLSIDMCRTLRLHFGDTLKIGPRLWEWARAEVARETLANQLGSSLAAVELSRVPEAAPRIAEALAARPYQSVAARFVAEGRSVILADTPGLGKTLEAIAGVIESGVPGPYLVCAPKTSLDLVWERELRHWIPDHNPIVVTGTRPQRADLLQGLSFLGAVGREDRARGVDPLLTLDRTWIITNIEMIRTKSYWICPRCEERWNASDKPKSAIVDCGHNPNHVKTVMEHEYPQLFDVEWGAIIMDESHRALLRRSGTPTQTRAGAKALRTRIDGLRIALSGTPMRGKPERLFGTLNWLRPEVYRGYWAWLEQFWNVSKRGYGGARVIGEFNTDRQADFYRSLGGIMLRRTKAEISPELPPKQYMDNHVEGLTPAIWLPMNPVQEKAYLSILISGSADIDGGRLQTLGALSELTRMKQFATTAGRMLGTDFQPALPSNKFDWLVQFLTDRSIIDGDEGPTGKVVVVSQFTATLDLFRQELDGLGLNGRTTSVTGRVTGAARAAAIDTFNDPSSGVDVMFLNTVAGGVAVTLDAADDMVLLDETHVPDDQEQVEDRINNRRPEERVATRRFWYLKSLGTVEEAIARVNLELSAQQQQHLDARRGIPYLRQVYIVMERLR